MKELAALKYAVFQDRTLVAVFLLRIDALRYVKDLQEYAEYCTFEIKEQF